MSAATLTSSYEIKETGTTADKQASLGRIKNVVRLISMNTSELAWMPLLILVFSSAISFIIFILLSNKVEPPFYSYSVNSPLWFYMGIGIQTLTVNYPFALSLGVSRWEFTLGSFIAAIGSAGALASIVAVLGLIEIATAGWGLGGYMFAVPWLWDAGWFGAWVVLFTASLLMFTVGFALAALFKRFGLFWLMLILAVALVALAVPLMMAISSGAWVSKFAWVLSLTVFSASAWLLLGTAIMLVLCYLLIRTYSPR